MLRADPFQQRRPAELRLEAEPPRHPFGCAPDREQHDQEALDALTCHEGERGFEEVKPAKRRELVEHHQDALSAILRMQILGEPATNLIQH